MTAALAEVGNPSSVHRSGVAARRILENARQALALHLNCSPKQILFTASGTEANALVLHQSDVIYAGSTEHPSILSHPNITRTIPVDRDGSIKLEALEELLASNGSKLPHVSIPLVSIALANNETGIIQDIPAIRDVVHQHGGLLHVDASQAIGRLPIDFALSRVDFMTVCFHKSGGPIGIAALIANDVNALQPLLFGGAQEQRRRAGTENIPAAAGLQAYIEAMPLPDTASLQQQLEAALPHAVVVGQNSHRLPNTSCLIMPGVKAETQVMHADITGIAISAGAACSSGKVGASHVLQAMGIEQANQAIRVSMGWNTTRADVDAFITAWLELYRRTR